MTNGLMHTLQIQQSSFRCYIIIVLLTAVYIAFNGKLTATICVKPLSVWLKVTLQPLMLQYDHMHAITSTKYDSKIH